MSMEYKENAKSKDKFAKNIPGSAALGDAGIRLVFSWAVYWAWYLAFPGAPPFFLISFL